MRSISHLRGRGRGLAVTLILLVSCLAVLQSPSNLSLPTVRAQGIVRVQGGARGTSTSSPISVTMSAAPQQGDTLIAVVVTRSYTTYSTVSSITQTGVTWTHVTGSEGSGYLDVEIWMGVVGSGASSSASVAVGSSVNAAVADISEYSGIVSSSSTDKTANNSGSGITTDTGTTPATAEANELWVGGIVSASGGQLTSPTNGFTLLDGTGYNYVITAAYLEKIVSSAGTADSGTAASSAQWAGAIATFKAATATTTTATTTTSSLSTTSILTTTVPQSGCYSIFMSGSSVEAEICATGVVVYSGTDAGSIISDVISALPGTGGKIYVNAGTYPVTTPIQDYSVSSVELYGAGNSTVLRAATNFNNVIIYVDGVNGWFIHDLQIDGNRANQNGNGVDQQQMGIMLWNSNNDVIQRCYIHDEKTYGIQATGQNIQILNNVVMNSNANGIILYGGSGYLVQGNIVEDQSDVGISISGQSSTVGITNVICTGNTILNTNLHISPYGENTGDGIIVGDNGIAGGNITVSGNYIYLAYYGMWINQVQGLTVSGNTIIPTLTCGFNCIGMAVGESGDEPTQSVTIQSNLISSASTGIYIYPEITSTVKFLSNTITSTGTPIETNAAPVIIEANIGYNPVGSISSPISGSTIVDSGSSSHWTSGTTYTNWESPKTLNISGGIVTAITVNGKPLSPSSPTVTLQPGDTFSITFSSTPTITALGQ